MSLALTYNCLSQARREQKMKRDILFVCKRTFFVKQRRMTTTLAF